ncbi:MAG TPA: hypothetical protein VL866_24260 [Pyrinomonadaceae bacterium]|nr:hypothetical protein [Pyrinomonadaceae bacterium]
MSTRLQNELRLLYAVEAAYKLPAAPIIRQLIAWEDAGLPDVLPPMPEWREFAWPASGGVNLEDYWRTVDKGKLQKWSGPYL